VVLGPYEVTARGVATRAAVRLGSDAGTTIRWRRTIATSSPLSDEEEANADVQPGLPIGQVNMVLDGSFM
jgi:hypothetical protein